MSLTIGRIFRDPVSASLSCTAVGKTPKEALEPVHSALQRAVLCVAQAQIVNRTPRLTLHPASVLIGRQRRFLLSSDHYYEIAAPKRKTDGWTLRTIGYRYTLSDQADTEIVSYHWHPTAQSDVVAPHLHLGNALLPPMSSFRRLHLPTGLITFAELLRMVIVDLGVESRRDDWPAVLSYCDTLLRQSLYS